MTLSAAPSRPTSVDGGPAGTRWVRSPAAIAAAVVSISRSGRSDRRTATQPATEPSAITPIAGEGEDARASGRAVLLDAGERQGDRDRST